MYHILNTHEYNSILNQHQIKREDIDYKELLELRKILGCGVYSAKLLLQRSNSVPDAVNLYHKVMKETINCKHISL